MAAIGSASILSLVLSGCAGGTEGPDDGDDNGELLTVDMAVSVASAMSAAPFAVAKELGFFEEFGCQIGEQIEGQSGTDPLRAVIDGGLDMGEVATNASIDGFLAGAEIKIVGNARHRPYDFTYAVRADSGIDSVEDMEGKRFGFSNPGSATEDIAYLMVEAVGMSTDDVELVPTSGVGGGIAMVESGEVDAALMVPIVFQRNENPNLKIGFEALDVIDAYQANVYIASQRFIDENPEGVRCILAGLNKAMEFIQTDTEQAAEIYAAENEEYDYEAILEDMQFANERNTLEGGVGFNVAGLEAVAHARELRTGQAQDIPWDEILDGSFLPDGVSSDIPQG